MAGGLGKIGIGVLTSSSHNVVSPITLVNGKATERARGHAEN